jgi:hypothetical protein
MELLKSLIREKVGYDGNMIAGSKSGYRNAYPNNFALFNANICILEKKLFKSNGVKVWWGDIDITKSRNALREIALELDVDIYVLSEMDGRFENDKSPIMKNFVYRANGNGTEELGEFYSKYYKLTESGELEELKS